MSNPENRRSYLLSEVAKAFDQGIDPFSPGWLREHDVTADECMTLSDNIAAILLGYLAADKSVRDALIKAYASSAMLEVLS